MGFETHTPTSTELIALAIYAVVDLLVNLALAFYFRKANEGTTDLTLYSQAFDFALVKHGGQFIDYNIANFFTVLTESFAFSFTYGAITAVGCSFLLAPYMDSSYGWLIVLNLQFMVLCFSCAFSTNGAHVVTPHSVHMIYYGFGLLSLFLYTECPAFYLVILVVAVKVFIWNRLKEFVWPDYPATNAIVPIFIKTEEMQPTGMYWKLWMTPRIVLSWPKETYEKFNKEIYSGDTWRMMFRLGFPILIYEGINSNITSTMFFGGCLGYVIRLIFGLDDPNDLTAIYVALGAGFGLIAFIVCTDGVLHSCCTDRFRFFSQFYPRTYTIASFTIGCVTIAANSDGVATAKKWVTELYVIAHVIHLLMTILVGLTCIASCKHMGCWAAWARNIPGAVSMNKKILEELRTSKDEHKEGDGLCIGRFIADTKEDQDTHSEGNHTRVERELEREALAEMNMTAEMTAIE